MAAVKKEVTSEEGEETDSKSEVLKKLPIVKLVRIKEEVHSPPAVSDELNETEPSLSEEACQGHMEDENPVSVEGANPRPSEEANPSPLEETNLRPLEEANLRPLEEANLRPSEEANLRPLEEANLGLIKEGNPGPEEKTPRVKVIRIKKEIVDDDRSEGTGADEDPLRLHREFIIKDEPVEEDVAFSCYEEEYEEVKSKAIVKNSKKSSKRTLFNFPTECTDVLPRKKTKQKNVTEVDQLMQSAMEGLQILQNHLTRPPDDHIEMFMHYIVSELREIKSPLNVMEAKQSIFNVVYAMRRRDLGQE